jgi:hypothetical protein
MPRATRRVFINSFGNSGSFKLFVCNDCHFVLESILLSNRHYTATRISTDHNQLIRRAMEATSTRHGGERFSRHSSHSFPRRVEYFHASGLRHATAHENVKLGMPGCHKCTQPSPCLVVVSNAMRRIDETLLEMSIFYQVESVSEGGCQQSVSAG